jgi:hypothetical protein
MWIIETFFSTFMRTVIEFYRHRTSKHVSANVLDDEEHQVTLTDQTYDIMSYGMW